VNEIVLIEKLQSYGAGMKMEMSKLLIILEKG
jgi:hypothetical protein